MANSFFHAGYPVRSCSTAQFTVSRGVELPAAGLADGDPLGLNKRGNLNLNLRGVGDATGVGLGVADLSVIGFLWISFVVGEGERDAAAGDDAALSAGEAVAAAFLDT